MGRARGRLDRCWEQGGTVGGGRRGERQKRGRGDVWERQAGGPKYRSRTKDGKKGRESRKGATGKEGGEKG